MYSWRGRRSFMEYAAPAKMAARAREDHFVLLALTKDRIAGILEMRNGAHVSLLFVEPEFQGRGVGGTLLKKAVAICRASGQSGGDVTVNASPNARGAYEKMGFKATGPYQTIGGVRSVPMKRIQGDPDERTRSAAGGRTGKTPNIRHRECRRNRSRCTR